MDTVDRAGLAPTPPRRARRRPRWATHIIAPLAVAAATGALLLVSAGQAWRPTVPVRVAPVVFDRQALAVEADEPPAAGSRHAGSGRSGSTVQAPGWLEADPYFVACTALASGVVEEILVLEGESVERDQVVAKLVAEDAELALRQAEAAVSFLRAKLDEQRAALTAAQASWDHPIERDRAVETARATLAEREAELTRLPALVDAARATLEALREELSRQEQALSSGAANELEVIVQRRLVAAQEARLASTEQRDAVLAAQVAAARAELRAAERGAELRIEERRDLDAARAHVADSAAQLEQAEAMRDEARLRLDRMTIRAPISGFVQRRLKSPGDKVMLDMDEPHSAHLVHIYDPEKIQVRVDIPLAEAASVFVGQRCEVIVEVLPDRAFAGEVTRITHEADLQKNTLQAKVRVIDPSPLLRPEMLTRVKFLPDGAASPARTSGQRRPGSLLAPRGGLAGAGSGPGEVWVVRSRRGDTGVAQPVDVEVLSTDEAWARVRGELRAGDLVVLGDHRLAPGQRVRIMPSEDLEGGQS